MDELCSGEGVRCLNYSARLTCDVIHTELQAPEDRDNTQPALCTWYRMPHNTDFLIKGKCRGSSK